MHQWVINLILKGRNTAKSSTPPDFTLFTLSNRVHKAEVILVCSHRVTTRAGNKSWTFQSVLKDNRGASGLWFHPSKWLTACNKICCCIHRGALCVYDLRKKATFMTFLFFKLHSYSWAYLVLRMTASPTATPTFLSLRMIYSSVFINMSICWFKKTQPALQEQKKATTKTFSLIHLPH